MKPSFENACIYETIDEDTSELNVLERSDDVSGGPMEFDNKPLVLDLVEWIGKEPKTYQEVMEAWRTSCPRLQVWEDAADHGFVTRFSSETDQAMVRITAEGEAFLKTHDRT